MVCAIDRSCSFSSSNTLSRVVDFLILPLLTVYWQFTFTDGLLAVNLDLLLVKCFTLLEIKKPNLEAAVGARQPLVLVDEPPVLHREVFRLELHLVDSPQGIHLEAIV